MPRVSHACSLAFVVLAAACASGPSAELDSRPVRVAGMAQPLKAGDCPEARRRAAENPGLDVDRNPLPVAMKPPVLGRGQVPPNVIGSKGAVIKADVIVDTLGRADMTTFKVVESSHPWLSAHVKNGISKWRFSPAELAGCKVPRVYRFSATSPAPKSAQPARKKAG
jgi:hypothetical protein